MHDYLLDLEWWRACEILAVLSVLSILTILAVCAVCAGRAVLPVLTVGAVLAISPRPPPRPGHGRVLPGGPDDGGTILPGWSWWTCDRYPVDPGKAAGTGRAVGAVQTVASVPARFTDDALPGLPGLTFLSSGTGGPRNRGLDHRAFRGRWRACRPGECQGGGGEGGGAGEGDDGPPEDAPRQVSRGQRTLFRGCGRAPLSAWGFACGGSPGRRGGPRRGRTLWQPPR